MSKISLKRTQKEQTVKVLQEKTRRAKSMVFADYRGLTTSQMSDLRKKLRETNADFVITKNTLLKMALQQTRGDGEEGSPRLAAASTVERGYARETEPAGPRVILEGPTATLFAYDDEIAPLKALLVFAKTLKLPQVKLGIFNQEVLSADQLDRLSKLPGREILIGQLLQMLNSPLFRLVNVLEGNIRNLIYVLQAIQDNKQKTKTNN